MLVAKNGAGKTSILDAAAIALGTVFVRIKGQDLKPPSFEEDDVRTSESSIGLTEEPSAPTERGLAIEHLKTVVSTGDFSDVNERKAAITLLHKVRHSTPLGEDSDVDLAEIELNWKLEG